jgi:outer membrane receptor protein involved in Fe transport
MSKRVSKPRVRRYSRSAEFGFDRRAVLRSTPLAAAISAIVAAVPSVILAQENAVIEEMLVTATRREANVQDIPINIAAFEGALLEEREISDLADLGRNVPGLYVVDQGKRSANHIVVRGLNLDPIISSEGLGNNGGKTVSTYLGEIPLYVDLALNDMDRVEVLLGPQGTLYGAGTLGGAIRYIPRRPELGTTAVTFRAATFDLSESDDFGMRGGVTANFPLGENLALRATVDSYDDPGFIDTPFLVRQAGVSDPEPDFSDPAAVAANLRSEEDVNGEETLSARIGLRWEPTAAIDANLTYYYQDMEAHGRTQNHVESFGTGRYQSATRYPEPNDRQNELLALEVTADLGFAELTSATGFAKFSELGQRDQTDLLITLEYYYETFPSFSAFTREEATEDTSSQEVRLVSQGDGAWNWIGGFFYLNREGDGESREFTPHFDEYLGGPLRPDSLEYLNVELEDLTEQAVFGEVGYRISDQWQVTLGGRYYDYTYETQSGVAFPLLETVFNDLPPDETGLVLEPNSQADDGFLFKVNSSYRFTDNLMGYVTISEGYRIGSSNGVGPCPDPIPPNQGVCALPDEIQYFPDSTTNYELGVHSQWLDRRLTVNAAVYSIDWKDPQLSSTTVNGAQPITKNGGGAESTGMEVSLDAQITDRLDIGFSYAHTTAELSSDAPDLMRLFTPPGFGPGTLYDGGDAVYIDGLAGDRLPGSPQDQGTFNIGYDLPLNGRWNLDLNYGLASIGGVLTKIGGRAGGEELGGFTVHSASAVLRGGSWTLGVYAQNLTNEYAVTGVRSTAGFVQTVADQNGDPVRVRSYAHEVLRPREIGLRFTYDLER